MQTLCRTNQCEAKKGHIKSASVTVLRTLRSTATWQAPMPFEAVRRGKADEVFCLAGLEEACDRPRALVLESKSERGVFALVGAKENE